MKANDSLLDLVLEAQVLDRVPRSGYCLRGVPEPESVTEHSWHVVFLVWMLGRRCEGIDVARAIQIALIHDLAEMRLGDLPRTAARYLAGMKNQAEAAAMDEILAPLTDAERAFYQEYQAGETAEARLVKACDKLQLMLKVYTYEHWGSGGGLAEFWDNPDNFPNGDFEPVRDLFGELLRRRSILNPDAPAESRPR